MKYQIEKKVVNSIMIQMDDLEKLLTERVADLHEIKGMMQARHAYIFYRTKLWDLRNEFTDSLTEVKPSDPIKPIDPIEKP